MSEAVLHAAATTAGAMDDLLIEIGCEELPPKVLDELRNALFAAVSAGLKSDNISFDSAASQAFSKF